MFWHQKAVPVAPKVTFFVLFTKYQWVKSTNFKILLWNVYHEIIDQASRIVFLDWTKSRPEGVGHLTHFFQNCFRPSGDFSFFLMKKTQFQII